MVRDRVLRQGMIVVLALLAAACAPATSAPVATPTSPARAAQAPTVQAPSATLTTAAVAGPLYGGTLVVPRWPDMETCNPAISTGLTVTEIMGNVFDGLVRQNGKFELEPQLAKSWEISPDGLTITFKLRDDVKWHDGVKFTAEDVKFTFENAIGKLHPRGRTVFGKLDRVDTPDDYTAIFHMKEPNAAFMFQINAPESLIIAKHIYEKEDVQKGDSATCKKLPIGTGPFKVTEFVPGERMTTVRNPEWWGTKGDYWGKGQPYLDRVIYPFIPDSSTRMLGFEKGELHYVAMLLFPPGDVARFKSVPGRDVITRCTTQQLGVSAFYGLNLLNKPLDDVRVRQAIAWAIDTKMINERVYFGTGEVTRTFVDKSSPWYNPDLTTYEPRDVKKANEILDQAGYAKKTDGTRFELKISYDDRPERTDLAKAFQLMMADIGIKVNMDGGDRNYSTQKTYITHDYDVTAQTLGIGDPSVGAARFFLSTNIGAAELNNSSAYVNQEMDGLWKEFSTNFDTGKRKAAIYKIEEMANRDLPYLFVLSTTYPAGINTAEFDGFHPDCVKGDAMMRTIWWKKGRPNP